MEHKKGKGGPGGKGTAEGDYSIAQGGDGGEGVIGDGGPGGYAHASGKNSKAVGGKGGRGGLWPGMPGQDSIVTTDNTSSYGGEGGESSQADGRGGRGGRAHLPESWGLPIRKGHMKRPYGEPNTDYGSGGDAPDTPQYMARRLIVERLKAEHPGLSGAAYHNVWYDREIVSIEWLNEKLAGEGHRWTVSIVDHEYEFTDI